MELSKLQQLAAAQGKQLSAEEIQRLISSAEGQQLMALMTRDGGQAVRTAAAAISKGDQTGAKAALSGLLSNPETAALLAKLGR